MNTGKTPAQRVCREGVLRLRSFAFRRSQDEVAVDAEGEGPVVLVLDGVDAGGPFRARACARRAEDAEPGEAGVHLGVEDIHAHVELRGDVALGAGADVAHLPVGIAVGHVGDRARLLGGEVGDRRGVEDSGKEVAGTGMVAAARPRSYGEAGIVTNTTDVSLQSVGNLWAP